MDMNLSPLREQTANCKKKKKKFRESMEDRKSAKSFVFSIVADYKIKCT